MMYEGLNKCKSKQLVFLPLFSFFLLLRGEISLIAQDHNLQITPQSEHTEVAKLYIAAQNLFNNKEYSAAIPLYRDVIANYHDVSAKAYLMIGRCYFEQQAYSQAIKWFDELVATFSFKDLEGMQAELKMYWGASFFYEKCFAEALAKFTGKGIPGADAIPPMKQPWYDMVGQCYEQLGAIEQNLETYNPHFYIHLAPIPKQNSPFIRANYWQIADKTKELRNLALYRIGESYLNEKRYEDAIHVLQKIMDTNFYKDAALLIGRCYFETGEYNRASAWFEERIKEYGNPPPIFYYYLGLSHYYQHRYEEAIKDFTIGQQVSAATIPAVYQYRLADALYFSNRYVEALKEYDKILREYPSSVRKIQAKYRKEECQSLLSTKEN